MTIRAGGLRVVIELTPTPLSRSYRVRIDYRENDFPQVRVLTRLERFEGRTLPHTFADGTLCLHLADDWNDGMLIADSTVPWAAEWLAYYEIWKATGEWHGGGEWPPSQP